MDRRAAILAAASGAAIALGAYVVTHRPTAGQDVAEVVEAAMDQARAPVVDRDAAEDERLTGDANEAGYRWAERRDLTIRDDCPTYSEAFHDGCISYVEDEGDTDAAP